MQMTTLRYYVAGGINDVITFLEKIIKTLFEWFKNNLLKRNAYKGCYTFDVHFDGGEG